MKPLFTAAMALLLSTCAFAQNFSSQQGPEFAATDGYSFENMAVSGDNTVVMLFKGNDYTFQVFDKGMKLQNTYTYKTERPCRYKAITNTGIYFFSFYYDEKNKAYKADVASASTTDFKFSTKTIFTLKSEELDTNRMVVDYANIFPADNIYNFIVSNDKSAFAFYIDFAGKKGTGNEKRLAVYNLADQKLLFENQFNDPESHSYIQWHEDFIIDKGHTAAYFTGFVKGRAKEGRRGELYYELEKLDATGYKALPLRADKNSATNSVKVLQNGNKLYCVGLYAEDPNSDRGAEGVCFYEVDPNGLTLKNSTFNPFTTRFNIDASGKEKSKKASGHFTLKTGGFANDGSLLFVVQDYRMAYSSAVRPQDLGSHATMQGKSGMGGGGNLKQDFGAIIAAKVSPEGSLAYVRNLNPNVPEMEGVIPYFCPSLILNGEVCLFFNSEKNAKQAKDKAKPKGDNLYFEAYVINDKGDIAIKDMVAAKADAVRYHPKFATDASGRFVFYGVEDKQRNLLTSVLK